MSIFFTIYFLAFNKRMKNINLVFKRPPFCVHMANRCLIPPKSCIKQWTKSHRIGPTVFLWEANEIAVSYRLPFCLHLVDVSLISLNSLYAYIEYRRNFHQNRFDPSFVTKWTKSAFQTDRMTEIYLISVSVPEMLES